MRLGLTLSAIDNTLYDAFGQRQVSTIYNALNQYHVVMEIAPRYWQDPRTLDQIYVSTSGANPTGVQQTGLPAGNYVSSTGTAHTAATIAVGFGAQPRDQCMAVSGHSAASTGAAVTTSLETMVPLSAFAKFAPGHTPLNVNHQGQFAASTISFNLAPGRSLSEAKTEIDNTIERIGMPSTVRGVVRRNRCDFSAIAIEHAASVRRRAGDDLYRAGDSLREPDPSAHHPLDAVLRQRRRSVGVMGCPTPSSRSSPRSAFCC